MKFHKPSGTNVPCLGNIPPELLLIVLGFLDAKTLLMCSAVSRIRIPVSGLAWLNGYGQGLYFMA
jgi:hypothetical protein